MLKIDTSGMSCPQPVLMTKTALKDNPKEITIIVDNKTAEMNVSRFLNHSGYSIIEVVNNDEEYYIKAGK